MNTKSPVNVLAVMDCAANTMRDMKCANRDLADVQAKAIREARAAVEELVEAAKHAREALTESGSDPLTVGKLARALAKFGGV